MIAQDEIPPVRHLVWQRDGAVAQRAVGDVRLIKQFAIDVDIAVFVDVDPLARQADNALNQHLVVVVKSDNIAALRI